MDELNFRVMLDAFADVIAARVLSRLPEVGHAKGRPVRRLLSVDEAAVYLGRSKDAVQHLIQADKLPVVRSDRRTMLDIRDLDEWIENNKSGGRN